VVPLIKYFPKDTKLRFMWLRRWAFPLSAVLSVLSIVMFGMWSLNFGIDFRGGTLIEIRTAESPADVAALRDNLGGLGLGEVEIQEFGGPRDVLIRIAQQDGGDQAQQEAISAVQATLGEGVEYRRVEVVGPRVSGELVQSGTIAVVLSILAILVYIWFRFEWHFALGAVAATLHDVVLTIGMFALLQIEFNLTSIAAILTIVGYSLNDTVVVYDRVRENLRRYKRLVLPDLLDLSINQMLARTMMTSVTTLLALLSLYIFGGEVIRSFTFAMIWGVLVGTYSSIFIAAPILIYLNLRDMGEKGEQAEASPAT
jgi:preprotein translocase subunit SecF